MKKIKYTTLVIITMIISHIPLQGQNTLKHDIINFMEKYEKYSSFTKDGLSYENKYESLFRSLFLVHKTGISEEGKKYQVFNDIDDKPPYLSNSNYVKKIRNNFPKGINVSLNIKSISKPKEINDYYSVVEVEVIKKLFGLTKDGKIYQKEFEMTFLIRRYKRKDGVTLKIVSITAKGFPRAPSGLFIGLNIQPSATEISTNGFLNENNTYGNWSQDGSFTFGGGIEMNYYLEKPLLGVGARINYTSFKSTFGLESYNQTSVTLADMDKDTFDLDASGNAYSETVQYSFIDIPIFMKFRYVLNNIKFLNHVYINLGTVFSYGISKTISSEGVYTFKGYYPDYHVDLQDIEEYGFYTKKKFVSKPESQLKSFNISGLAEIGLNILLLGDKLNMNVSIIYQKGLLNLSRGNNDYLMTLGYNNYNALIDSRSKVSTGLFGLNIGILYKMF